MLEYQNKGAERMTQTQLKNLMSKTKVIDLFCGIGGLTYGLIKEDFNVVAGFDIDPSCQFAYEANNDSKFYNQDIGKISQNDISKLFDNAKIKILVGCAPCQPFSKYTLKQKKDERWGLLYKFADIIECSSPDIISMENVPQLIKHQVFKDFVKLLEDNHYFISYANVFCPNYGIPQNRTRLVLLASKFNKITLIEPTHKKDCYIDVASTIGHLEPIADGVASLSDPIHFSRKLSDTNKKRIQQSKQGGTWRNWNSDLLLDCHKKETGKTYTSVYGRMKWNEPAPTMTTQCIGFGNGRFGHPEQDRAISLREASLFQTFPEDYKFVEDFSKPIKIGQIAKQIGNAVPTKLGSIIGKSIKNHLQEVF